MTSGSERDLDTDVDTETEADSEVFEDFFARTHHGMLARAVMLCGHREDAEDAVIEAYGLAAQRWDRLRDYESPEGWVFLVVQQRLWKQANAFRRQRATLLRVPVARQATTEQTAEARAALAALAALPKRQRIVMVLNCLYGMPQQEIADQLGIKRTSVAAHVFKARRALEETLGIRPDEPGEDTSALVASASGGPKRPTSLFTSADPLAKRLAETETWLRAGFDADPGALDAARARLAAVLARATGGRA
jgi:RNA polymerase sigma factor (sigma-70 family)